MAQILLEDSIDSLKRNDMKGALLHLNFSSQQLEAGVNSTAIQTVRILIDDAALAIKNGDIDKALVHLRLASQQLTTSSNLVTSVQPKIATETVMPTSSKSLAGVNYNDGYDQGCNDGKNGLQYQFSSIADYDKGYSKGYADCKTGIDESRLTTTQARKTFQTDDD